MIIIIRYHSSSTIKLVCINRGKTLAYYALPSEAKTESFITLTLKDKNH